MNESNKPVIIKNLRKLFEDVEKKEEFNEEIKLIANSGIQFIDFELDDDIDFDSHDEKLDEVYDGLTKNKFVLVTKDNQRGSDKDSCTFAKYHLHQSGTRFIIDDDDSFQSFNIDKDNFESDERSDSPSVLESVQLYNGIWFPIPYFPKGLKNGPTNFARARIVNNGDIKKLERGGKYHVTIAIDTKVDNSQYALHGAPTLQDIDHAFSFRSGFEATQLLRAVNSDGISFVDEWTKSILKKVYPQTTTDKQKKFKVADDNKDETDNLILKKTYQKHYLNVLAFLDAFFKPNDIRLVHFDKDHCDQDKIIDVSLILDVGNTRTCGLLVEADSGQSQSSDTFPNSSPLIIRDLNCPEYTYTGAFESKIQFQKANFDFNNCSDLSSRLDAFVWPSLVRIGPEASNLSALLKGNEGNTGLTSPKRSLWQIDKAPKIEWKFNESYYQIPLFKDDDGRVSRVLYKGEETGASVIYQPVTGYLNSLGDALFATGDKSSCMSAFFTGKSTMTFMLVEIILQAMMQMNSYFYRKNMEYRDLPRRLKALVLTTPPSMPDVEKEIFRSCAYQALGIIWKAYGYDKTDATEFHFISKKDEMFPPVPEIHLKWDETLAGQIVYLYNETQRIYNGNSKDFIKDIRRSDADGRFNEISKIKVDKKYFAATSARIASIDIGGGTTDLIIADYSVADVFYDDVDQLLKKENGAEAGNQSGSIQIREVLKDGFKIAGDDLVYELLQNPIKHEFEKTNDEYWKKLFGATSGASSGNIQSRVQVVDKIFTKVAYRLISRLEQLDKIDVSTLDSLEVIVKGSIKDFVQGTEKFALEELNNREDLKLPSLDKVEFAESVSSYITKQLGISFEEFLNIPLEFDIFKIDFDISQGITYDMCKNINYLNAIVNVYRCDVLLLTGRPTKIPGIRRLIEKKSSLSSRRIIPMYDYKCEGWYPTFETYNGRIGDPKTSVVVGALLGYTKSIPTKLMTFKLNTNPIPAISPMRYLGVLDDKKILENKEILYLFQSEAEGREQQGSYIGDYESLHSDYNDAKLTIFKKPKFYSEDDITVNIQKQLPVNLGYRQFNNPSFTGNMYLVLSMYEDVKDLPSIKAINTWNLKGDIEFNHECLEQLKQPDNLFGMMTKRAKGDIQKIVDGLEAEFVENIAKLDEINNDPYQAEYDDLNNMAQTTAEKEAQTKVTAFNKLLGAQAKRDEEIKKLIDDYIQKNKPERDRKVDLEKQKRRNALKQSYMRSLGKAISQCREELISAETKKLEQIKNAMTGFNQTDPHYFKISLMRGNYEEKSFTDNNPICQCINFIRQEYKEAKIKDILESIFILDLDKVIDTNTTDNGVGEVTSYMKLQLQTVSSADGEYWNNTGKI